MKCWENNTCQSTATLKRVEYFENKDKYSKLFKLQTGHSSGAISKSFQTTLTNLHQTLDKHFNPDEIPPDKVEVIIMPVQEKQDEFWLDASKSTLSEIWNNKEDDEYEKLL